MAGFLKINAATGGRLLKVLCHRRPVCVYLSVCFALCFLNILHEEQTTATIERILVMATVVKEWKRNTTATAMERKRKVEEEAST